MMFVALALTSILVLTTFSIVAVIRLRVRSRHASSARRAREPVTILKPLCGADDALEANLETFFRQTHPVYELVFGIEGASDPALPVVRKLRFKYPHVRVRVAVHDGKRALNPKVSNLRAMLARGSHDLVIISDSNVSVHETWLAEMVAELEPGVGLVTNIFVGTGEETLGATLENLHLAGPVAGGVAVSNELGEAAAVGKSMLFRKSVFEGLGGFESVGAFLAEDYVMGKMFAAAGLKVRLAKTTVTNIVKRATVAQFLKRHTRWSLLRSRLMPHVYVLEPLANPMLLVVLSLFSGRLGEELAVLGVSLTLLRDAIQWLCLRGRQGLATALPLGPFKELMMLGVWAVAPFLGRVAWRGKSFRVAAGTRLYADRQTSKPELLTWE